MLDVAEFPPTDGIVSRESTECRLGVDGEGIGIVEDRQSFVLSCSIDGKDVELGSTFADSRQVVGAKVKGVEAGGIDDDRLVRREQEAMDKVSDFRWERDFRSNMMLK